MTIYALSLTGLFASSSAYHSLRWSAKGLRWMRALDHSMIFVLIAGTYTAFGELALGGAWRFGIVAGVWIGALAGIALKIVNLDGRIGGALYITLGWIVIVALPEVLRKVQTVPLLLVVAGGILYTTGAVVLVRRRPDPSPLAFGYLEIWHSIVVLAGFCHYLAIMVMLRSLT
jgi:hemolysin III